MGTDTRNIPLSFSYNERLTFRIAPVNKKIMSADADWLLDEEMCMTPEVGISMLLPFIEPYMKHEFKFDEEINTMAFSSVKALIRDLTQTCDILEKQFNNPALTQFKDQLPLAVIAGDAAASIATSAGKAERNKLLKENLPVILRFYDDVIDQLKHYLKDFREDGFRHIAITTP
ncbi:MAG: hypothetical protein KBS83_02250 [Lachnospiraceae bacterium]|nr:hypothetical protein [Candidatus Equihabitans merdae]